MAVTFLKSVYILVDVSTNFTLPVVFIVVERITNFLRYLKIKK